MKNFNNILIVRTDRIGDVVLTTPAIKALRQTYPKAMISILVSPLTKDLLEGNPNLDEILVDDRKNEHRGGRGFLKLMYELKKRKFDLAIIFHTKKRTNFLCFLAGIPYRVGYKNNKFGFLLNHPIFDTRHEGKKHEAQYCLDVLKDVGIESHDLTLSVSIKQESERWVEQVFLKNNITSLDRLIAIHPGASDSSKRLSEDRFAQLIDILQQRYACKIVLVGGADTKAVSCKILSQVKSPVLDFTGLTTVSQLVSLLRKCKLLISNDSGPVHIASALGIGVISIFTRNQPGINPERWKPLGAKSKVIAVPCNTNLSFKKAQPVASEDSELILTQELLEAVDAVFKLC